MNKKKAVVEEDIRLYLGLREKYGDDKQKVSSLYGKVRHRRYETKVY